MKIEGYLYSNLSIVDRQIFVNGEIVRPDRSLKIVNHSPGGFMWGYEGSGPAQAALAILLHVKDQEFAVNNYQSFKKRIIAKIPMDKTFSIEIDDETLDFKKDGTSKTILSQYEYTGHDGLYTQLEMKIVYEPNGKQSIIAAKTIWKDYGDKKETTEVILDKF